MILEGCPLRFPSKTGTGCLSLPKTSLDRIKLSPIEPLDRTVTPFQPLSHVQRQPLTPVAFMLNTQDDDESDIDEDENIDPSLCTLAPTQSSNPATTESMQVDKTIEGRPKSGHQAKEALRKRLGL